MHKSQVFLFGLVAFVVGVGVRSFIPVSIHIVVLIAAVGSFFVIFWFLERDKSYLGFLGMLFLLFACGIMRLSLYAAAEENATILFYADAAETVVRGVVGDEPDVREKNTRLVVDVVEVITQTETHATRGRMLLFVDRYPAFQYGDEVLIRGRIQKPESFSGFDYPAYLAKDHVYALMYYPRLELISSHNGNAVRSFLLRIKQSFERGIERALPEPHAAFLKGILLGSRASIPAWLFDAFRATGVVHIIALSGFNVTIIADNVFRALRQLRVSSQATFWISGFTIFLFTIMVGASPSIVRASLMGCLALLAQRVGRQYQAKRILTITGAGMVLYNPALLRFDVAFQLSFLATAGLLYISPRIEHWFHFVPAFGGIRGNVISTTAAQLMVLPLLVFYFGAVSLVSPLSNLLVLLLMPVTMFFGFFAALSAMLWAPLGSLLGGIAYALLSYHIAVVTLLSRVPWASVHVGSLF